jgi:hypothetical protein
VSTPADTSAVTQALTDPLASAADGQSVTDRSVAEKVLAIQFAAACLAAVLPHRGLRFTRIRLPAQVSGHCGPACGCNSSPGPGGFG